MRIVSWNVNGLRACAKKGFLDVLNTNNIDVLCLQEVRAFPEQLTKEVLDPKGWHAVFSPAERPGYSGVAIYSKKKPTKVINSLGVKKFDEEGRFLVTKFGRLSIASIYFPNGSGKDRDNSRVPYKLDFCDQVLEHIKQLEKTGPVLVTGDYNTAHHEIDIARPKSNKNSSGFLLIEREVLSNWEKEGWVDTFRSLHPNEPDHYTWWRQFGGMREANVGWRIDYIMASKSASKRIKDAFIWPNILGSDHCPIGVDID